MKPPPMDLNLRCTGPAALFVVLTLLTPPAHAAITFLDSGQNLGGNASSVDIALGDVDGDGDLDAVVGTFFADSRVWINQGGSQAGTPGTFLFSDQNSGYAFSYGLALVPIDAEPGIDAFVTRGIGPDNVWLNGGTGQFSDSGQELGNDGGFDVALGDLDGDDDLDAFVANNGADKVWLNNGGGTFADSGQSLGSGLSLGVALGDVDGDGDLDAVVAASGPDRVWINQGGEQGGTAGIFGDSGQALRTSLSTDVALDDLDGDGDLDFIVARSDGNRVYENNGNGQFSDTGLRLGTGSAQAVALGDLDGDGRLDAFVANDGTPDSAWFNRSSPGNTLTPEDFGPSADRIGFDNLKTGAAVAWQLTMQGVRFRSLDGSDVIVSDPRELDASPALSPPYAALVSPGGVPQTGMSQVQLNSVEVGCLSRMFTSNPRSAEAQFNVEGHITAFLWDLWDGWGRGNDAWDQVDGQAINGHRNILQILDRELDDGGSYNPFDDAPDLRDFYRAWLDRFPGLDFVAGHPVADAILNANGLVPGTDPGEPHRPFPVIEGNPVLPSATLANLILPDGSGTIPQYDPPVAAAHADGEPVLTIRRQWSYIDAVPGLPSANADQVTVLLGFSNFGAVTVAVDAGVEIEDTAPANWTATIVFSPNATGWLSVSPTSGTFTSEDPLALTEFLIQFTAAMRDLQPRGPPREIAHVHLGLARCIPGVGHPLAVRRESRVPLAELRRQEGARFQVRQ